MRDFMRIITYLIIFTLKIIENALATLRLIFVSNGKKLPGAILNFVTSIIWILTAGMVIININEDIFKVIFFCLGSFVGSYTGSYIENKLAIGSNLIICIIDKEELKVIDELRNKGYGITTVPGYGKDSEKYVLLIFEKRKNKIEITNEIKSLSNSCMIISEVASPLYGGHNKA